MKNKTHLAFIIFLSFVCIVVFSLVLVSEFKYNNKINSSQMQAYSVGMGYESVPQVFLPFDQSVYREFKEVQLLDTDKDFFASQAQIVTFTLQSREDTTIEILTKINGIKLSAEPIVIKLEKGKDTEVKIVLDSSQFKNQTNTISFQFLENTQEFCMHSTTVLY